jgi:hypothetical protein
MEPLPALRAKRCGPVSAIVLYLTLNFAALDCT